ncbi:hypothetical protein EUGRSUZ_B03377 [Eucalyptus grandis]|uniref:Uncharacterized protein n=2 Tax=Eucalyptus grandis TaxID=71139 RepID=A0ACC3LX56_EUCGR|nr:hypothetical protein EUGRSUZ_B03377 [Eucalyptus grandis]
MQTYFDRIWLPNVKYQKDTDILKNAGLLYINNTEEDKLLNYITLPPFRSFSFLLVSFFKTIPYCYIQRVYDNDCLTTILQIKRSIIITISK